jgi:MFS family permease
MQRPNTRFKRGVVAGVLAAAAAALWFFVLDFIAGRPFQTPGAVASSLLFAKTTLEITTRTVAAYYVFHVIVAIIGGVIFVAVAEKIERRPSFVLVALLFLILLQAFAIVNLATYAQWGIGFLGVVSLTVGIFIGTAVMAWYTWATHPRLRDLGERPPPPDAVRI